MKQRSFSFQHRILNKSQNIFTKENTDIDLVLLFNYPLSSGGGG